VIKAGIWFNLAEREAIVKGFGVFFPVAARQSGAMRVYFCEQASRGGAVMSLARTWYALDEAEAKYGVEKRLILQWVEEGVVRAESEGQRVARVHGDDLELKIQEWERQG
jgi:hypothetical protein